MTNTQFEAMMAELRAVRVAVEALHISTGDGAAYEIANNSDPAPRPTEPAPRKRGRRS